MTPNRFHGGITSLLYSCDVWHDVTGQQRINVRADIKEAVRTLLTAVLECDEPPTLDRVQDIIEGVRKARAMDRRIG